MDVKGKRIGKKVPKQAIAPDLYSGYYIKEPIAKVKSKIVTF